MIDEYVVNYEEYPAIGSGGISYLDGTLYINSFSLRDYARRIDEGHTSAMARTVFPKRDVMRYRFMMDLFGLSIDKRAWKERFGCSVAAACPWSTRSWKVNGAFDRDDDEMLTLTPRGRYLMVVMMRQFFIGVNSVRDQARAALPGDEHALIFGECPSADGCPPARGSRPRASGGEGRRRGRERGRCDVRDARAACQGACGRQQERHAELPAGRGVGRGRRSAASDLGALFAAMFPELSGRGRHPAQLYRNYPHDRSRLCVEFARQQGLTTGRAPRPCASRASCTRSFSPPPRPRSGRAATGLTGGATRGPASWSPPSSSRRWPTRFSPRGRQGAGGVVQGKCDRPAREGRG